MSDDTPPAADRALLRQHRERAANNDAPAFLTAGIVAHVGIADDHGPVVIPMTYQFDAAKPDRLYVHGAHNSRLLEAVASGAPVCVTVTIADGLVYSKTALNHSVNYRSVVVFCHAAPQQPTGDEARNILHAMISRYWPGRTAGVDFEVTPDKHVDATNLVALQIDAMSAKTRAGGSNGPGDDDPAVPGTAGVTELRPGY